MIAAAAIVAVLWQPMTLVFVRHAETQANATGRYNSRTIDSFSARGEAQVLSLTKSLAKLRFDAIAVSPSVRALRTIAPYLRAHHLVAEVWPELYECCDANTRKVRGPTATVQYGNRIALPRDLVSLFVLVPAKDRYVLSPSYEDGLKQVQLCAMRLQKEFGGTGKTVLVVGHSLQGGRMLEFLEGKAMAGRLRPGNTQILTMRERADHRFAALPPR